MQVEGSVATKARGIQCKGDKTMCKLQNQIHFYHNRNIDGKIKENDWCMQTQLLQRERARECLSEWVLKGFPAGASYQLLTAGGLV